MLTVIVVLLGVGAYVAYTAYQRYVVQLLTVPGCQAGTGDNAIALDFGQAADAATIAAVATRERLPARALTIAYATAWQESKLENLTYGDRDSVGIFQQRPSMGWGSAKDLKDPAFASRAFFRALVKVKDYTKIPVYQAAQDVQRSADGYAYDQYTQSGELLTKYYTSVPHAVTCWYNPGTQAASAGVSAKLNLTGAAKGLTDAFGKPEAGSAVTKVTPIRSGHATVVKAPSWSGWAVANWLMANASSYGITKVSYAGYHWTATLTESSWQRDPNASAGGIVAS